MFSRTLNDLSAKWISESGLFELASSSIGKFQKVGVWGSAAKHQEDGVLLSTGSCSCCKADC